MRLVFRLPPGQLVEAARIKPDARHFTVRASAGSAALCKIYTLGSDGPTWQRDLNLDIAYLGVERKNLEGAWVLREATEHRAPSDRRSTFDRGVDGRR